jgi:hypothetical protein
MAGKVPTPECQIVRDYCVKNFGLKSASVIAFEIEHGACGAPYPITRNGVIGHWNRAPECKTKRETQKRLKTNINASKIIKPKKHKNGGRITAMFMPMITPIQAPPPPEPDPSAPARRFGDPWPMTATAVTLLKRENNQCAFPLWGWDNVPLEQKFYCGAPVALGESYCDTCKKRMYTPSYAKLRQMERQKVGVAA